MGWRYRVIFETRWCLVELCETNLARAIAFAQRISEGGWWEVIDSQTNVLVASSESN